MSIRLNAPWHGATQSLGSVTLIGLVGKGMPGEPLLDFDDLVRDARLSRALGVHEIAVFQLDWALQVFGEDFVRRLTAAVNGPQSDVTVECRSRARLRHVLWPSRRRCTVGCAWLAGTGMACMGNPERRYCSPVSQATRVTRTQTG